MSDAVNGLLISGSAITTIVLDTGPYLFVGVSLLVLGQVLSHLHTERRRNRPRRQIRDLPPAGISQPTTDEV